MEIVQQVRPTRRILINPMYKDRATILKTSHETGGAYSLGELEVFPGGGNGTHTHSAFTETFTAVKGILGVNFKGKKMYLKPGESFTIPKHTPHYFFNDDDRDTVVCQVKLQPGHEGFEKGLAIAYGLAQDGLTNKKGMPKKLSHLALVVHLTDTNLVGFGSLFQPIFRWLANRAKKNGMERELLEKYYYE